MPRSVQHSRRKAGRESGRVRPFCPPVSTTRLAGPRRNARPRAAGLEELGEGRRHAEEQERLAARLRGREAREQPLRLEAALADHPRDAAREPLAHPDAHLHERGLRAQRRRRREAEAREAGSVGQDEGREGRERRGTVEREARDEMAAARARAARPAGTEHGLGRPAGELHAAERRARHGGHVLPARDGGGRHAPALAEGPVRRVLLELMREDAQRPRREVGRRRAAAGGLERGRELGLEGHAHVPYDGRGRSATALPCLPGGARMRYGSRMPGKEDLCDEAVDLFGDGKLDEAVAKYREALTLDPGYVDAWHGLAMAFNELGRHPEAIEAGKKLCELTPDDVLAHTSLSRFYQAAGMVPEAEAEGAKARVLDWKRQLKEEKPE